MSTPIWIAPLSDSEILSVFEKIGKLYTSATGSIGIPTKTIAFPFQEENIQIVKGADIDSVVAVT